MEGVLRNLQNVIVYIDDLLIHSDTHERHLQTLEQVLQRLQQNHLKINLDKCIFGNKEVSYLGFTLMPEGIKPGKNKLKAIETAEIPTDIKTIRSFVGLCNFFRTHIKNFAIVAAPLFKLTRKDSGYKGETTARRGQSSLQYPQEATHLRTSHGFSQGGPPICFDHRRRHRHRQNSRRPGSHPDSNGQGRKILRHLIRLTPAQGS